MVTVFLAAGLAVQLIAPAVVSAGQSQFTRGAQSETMRFREMDRNNDGVITRAEWRGTEQSFRTNDWNADGILSGDEVRPGATRPADTGLRDDREDDFENLDANRNNQIERSEWRESDDAFRWLDRNNDGVLNRREIVGRGAGARTGARDAQDRRPRSQATGETARGGCVDNAARIVDDIYQQVLERSADQASAGMTQALASGRMTVRDIVRDVAKSPEHAQRYFWQPMARRVYQRMLKRDPNQEELEQMASELSTGGARPLDIVARSARRSAGSDEEAVRILYRQLLGREADPEGLRGFTDLARREGIERVARDIVASPEYRQRAGAANMTPEAPAYEAAVSSLYRHVLGRDPDATGMRDLTRIAETSGVNAVVDRMLTSAEYDRLYGDDVVPGRGARYCGARP